MEKNGDLEMKFKEYGFAVVANLVGFGIIGYMLYPAEATLDIGKVGTEQSSDLGAQLETVRVPDRGKEYAPFIDPAMTEAVRKGPAAPHLISRSEKLGDIGKSSVRDSLVVHKRASEELEVDDVLVPEPQVSEVIVTVFSETKLPQKPRYTEFALSDQKSENGFIDVNDDYRIMITAPSDNVAYDFAVFPQRDNEFRVTDFPGYCARLAMAEYGNGSAIAWLPRMATPDIRSIDRVVDVVGDPTLSRGSQELLKDIQVGMWVICTDGDGGSRPFDDPEILKRMSGVKLGNPTRIFEE